MKYQPAVLTRFACPTQISIFTSKTKPRFYVTSTVFTKSRTQPVTALTKRFRSWTSYGINDHLSDIAVFCFKSLIYKSLLPRSCLNRSEKKNWFCLCFIYFCTPLVTFHRAVVNSSNETVVFFLYPGTCIYKQLKSLLHFKKSF